MTPHQVHRASVLTLASAAFAIAITCMLLIAQATPWYRNTDMNMHNVVDALALNTDIAPNPFAQPATPLKALLAVNYRVQHALGWLPVANLDQLAATSDPVRALPPLVRAGCTQQTLLVLLTILAGAGLVYSLTREFDAAIMAIILLSGSAGLLFQGLLIRPELLCVALGNIGSLWCANRATRAKDASRRHLWIFAAGLLVGCSTLEKLPGLLFSLPCLAWCLLHPLKARGDAGRRDWTPILPTVAGIGVLLLLHALMNSPGKLVDDAVNRLRYFAFAGALLPLLRHPGLTTDWRAVVRGGIRDAAMLGGGILLVLPLTYLLLRATLSPANTLLYLTGVLNFLAAPTPYMAQLAPAENLGAEILRSLQETPLLFAVGLALPVMAVVMRGAPRHLRLMSSLLVGVGIGFVLVLSRRHFSDQYSIFAQVPLLLALPLAFSGLLRPGTGTCASGDRHWLIVPALVAAFVLCLGVYIRLQPKHYYFQDDIRLPVSELTLTFLFDHDAHPARYRQLMQDHYQDRVGFRRHLDHYLEDPR